MHAVHTHFHLPSCLRESCSSSIISGPKFSLIGQTRLFISTPPNSQQTSHGCQDSRSGCCALPMGQNPAPTPREAGGTAIRFRGAGLLLGSRSTLSLNTPLPHQEAFPFSSAGKSGIWQDFRAQQKCAYTRGEERHHGWCTLRGIWWLLSLQVTGH